MVPQKFMKMGFDITGFGASSRALRFNQKPIFIFNAEARMDEDFIEHICTTYLKICDKRKESVCIRTA